MSKRLPSLAALLGLVAIAGYQNREKIGEFVKSLTGNEPGKLADDALANVKGALGEGPVASRITGGLSELVDHFRGTDQADKAESWIGAGANAPISAPQIESALGADLIDGLVAQTGLDRKELLARLSQILPEAVDRMTPDGRVPG